ANKYNRTQWSSTFGFVLAAAGSAVGLGNMWKFPYMVGMNGGGAFVLVYIFCIILIGIPILLAELYIGQNGRRNTVASYEAVHKKQTKWRIAGTLGLLSAFIITTFYSVIGGWILGFELYSILGKFGNKSDAQISSTLNILFQSPGQQILLHGIFMLTTMGIVMSGIQKGIEKFSKILLPSLFILLLGLIVYSYFLPGFIPAIKFLLLPDFSQLSWNSILKAMGHAFFTLSIGVGVMVTYGSYLAKNEDTPKLALKIVIIDTIIALIAGIIIFSAVFSYDVEANSGPTLVFQTLPVLFNKMSGGYYISVTFFLLFLFTALTSAISILEVVVTYCMEMFNRSRFTTTIITGLCSFLIGILSALSTNKLSNLKFLGMTFFDFFDKITSSLFLPLSGLVTAIFFGWILGANFLSKIVKNNYLKAYLLTCLKFIAPPAIFIILIKGLI
ncbi:MAG: sodium-dependent transporter, partial [Legionellales bacterium]|nr:sodium-dependent transporter [Legionellales bacterium]